VPAQIGCRPRHIFSVIGARALPWPPARMKEASGSCAAITSHATELTINILACVAQGEARLISERTKVAQSPRHQARHAEFRCFVRLLGLEAAWRRHAKKKQTLTNRITRRADAHVSATGIPCDRQTGSAKRASEHRGATPLSAGTLDVGECHCLAKSCCRFRLLRSRPGCQTDSPLRPDCNVTMKSSH
jgi:hypothetical protein